jgi:hypothetical protein
LREVQRERRERHDFRKSLKLLFSSCLIQQLMPFTQGDGENDVGMLTAAGFGVSMGNAMDAPRLAAE